MANSSYTTEKVKKDKITENTRIQIFDVIIFDTKYND